MAPPTSLSLLLARKSSVLTALAAMGTTPDYSIGGQSLSWAADRRQLLDELASLNVLIIQEQPFEIHTVALR